jgi:predicted negative regulator of RcsB-dependent stress response
MDGDEGAITSTLCRLERALGASRDDRQRAAVKLRIASVLRRIGLYEEATYLTQEAEVSYGSTEM